MREERGLIDGDQTIAEPYTLWGEIRGNVLAKAGSTLKLRGTIDGDLTVADGGRVHVYGTVTGDVVVRGGAKVILSGLVQGDVVNDWGKVYVDRQAKIDGSVTGEGDTLWDKGPSDA